MVKVASMKNLIQMVLQTPVVAEGEDALLCQLIIEQFKSRTD